MNKTFDERVFERDMGICQHCISTGKGVLSRLIKCDGIFTLANGITLCEECYRILSPTWEEANFKFPSSENDHLLKWCKSYMKKNGIYGYKVHGGNYQNAGIPDLDIIFHGISVRVELKLFGNPLTRIQYETMKEMQENGAIVGVAHTLEEFKLIIEKAHNRYLCQKP